jgi:phenylpropionate dioxygenase-like ring-hydroxylating dioxygenase large terminal subunit
MIFRCIIISSLIASGYAFVSFQLWEYSPPMKSNALKTALSSTTKGSQNENRLGGDVEPTFEQFNWFKAWYPIVPVNILDPEKPHSFELLGQAIVVWNDAPVEGVTTFQSKKSRPRRAKRQSASGTWRAFVDECPHRKVPLSEGRVEDDGTLLCSYHAWRFEGSGNCVAIPSMESTDTLERILATPSTSCRAFPTTVINGVLFVWPSSDENAALESALTPVTHRPTENVPPKRLYEGPWKFRELPYSADFFVENAVDPAHVSISHHNIAGNRYANQLLTLKTTIPLTKHGFAVRDARVGSSGGQTSFYAPSVVAIDVPFGTDGGKQTLELYVSPSRPGFCNQVSRTVIVKDSAGKMPAALKVFAIPMPKWLNHIMASTFWNQDGLFLHHQERSMALTGQYTSLVADGKKAYNYNKAIYPVNSDLGVIHFRNWLRTLAGGRIPYKNNPTMPPASSSVVFDVWNSHTKYCRYCQVALKRLQRVRLATLAAAACLAIVRPWGVTATLLSSVGLASIGLGVNKLLGLFYRYEYSHAEND